MVLIKRFFAFWYDFIVGDDWTVAAGVVILLAVSGALARANMNTAAWLLMPIGVMVLLASSLRRAIARQAPRRREEAMPRRHQ
jgi:hypothetical protein